MTRLSRITGALAFLVTIVVLATGCGAGGAATTPTAGSQKPTSAASESQSKSAAAEQKPASKAADTAQKPAATAEAAAKPADGSPQAILDALAKLPAAERQQKLEEGARKEGKAVAYVLGDIETWEALKRDFQQKYPYVTMEYLRGQSEELLERTQAEGRAGKLAADFIMNSKSYILIDDGLIMPYSSPAKEAISPKLRSPYHTLMELNPAVIAWNTNLVKPQDAPKNWEDLLDPKWKGRKISLEAVPEIMVMALYDKLGIEGGREFLRKLVAQDPIPSRSHTTSLEQLAGGEFPLVAEAYGYRAMVMARQKNAPISWVMPDPMPSTASDAMLSKTAPHPYAGALLYDYMMSADAGSIYAKFGRIPIQPGAQSPFAEDQRAFLEAKGLYSLNPDLYRKNYDTVIKDIKTILQPVFGE